MESTPTTPAWLAALCALGCESPAAVERAVQRHDMEDLRKYVARTEPAVVGPALRAVLRLAETDEAVSTAATFLGKPEFAECMLRSSSGPECELLSVAFAAILAECNSPGIAGLLLRTTVAQEQPAELGRAAVAAAEQSCPEALRRAVSAEPARLSRAFKDFARAKTAADQYAALGFADNTREELYAAVLRIDLRAATEGQLDLGRALGNARVVSRTATSSNSEDRNTCFVADHVAALAELIERPLPPDAASPRITRCAPAHARLYMALDLRLQRVLRMSVTEHDVQPEHVNELRGILALASAAQQNRAAVELALQMRAAVYARRSTEEQQGASLDVQLEEARRYIAGKGWTLDEQLIFVEDGVSRAEFQKRPALIKMITAAEARRFDALVVRDESRLGGDTARTTIIMSDLIDCGVRLFHYSTDEEIVIENAVDRFIVTARNFAAEVEREKIASRTREHHKSKARRGLNTGGKLYGYDNHEVKQGERRTHVEYVLNENEAAVVRELFERFAAGEGYRPIARSLNDRRIPSPRAGGRGTGSWAPSVIRAMLANEMYRGVRIWGRFEKGYRKGTKVRLRRPDSEWVRVEKPELRIVSDELWDAVVRRRQAARRLYGRGGPSNGKTPRMLSGLAKCGLCGGPMHVEKARFGKGSVRVYYCAWHRTRGSSVCANSVRRPEAELNDAVVQWIKKSVLSEELIVATLDEVRRRLRSKQVQVGSEQKRLREDAAQLRIEIDRLTTALAATDAKPASVIRAIAERESRLAEVEATLAAAEATPQIVELELRRLEREARARLEDLRGLLERNPVEGRKVLEALLVEPLTFTPTGQNQARRYEIRGRFVTGAVCGGVSVPTGI